MSKQYKFTYLPKDKFRFLGSGECNNIYIVDKDSSHSVELDYYVGERGYRILQVYGEYPSEFKNSSLEDRIKFVELKIISSML